MAATIRKNFALKPIVVKHLEEIAADMNTSLTKALQELIEKKYAEKERAKKLEAFHRSIELIKESSPNPFLEQFAPDDTKVIQKVKAMMYE